MTSKEDVETVQLMGNQELPKPKKKIPSLEQVHIGCLTSWIVLNCLSWVVYFILTLFNTSEAIDLCTPVNISNTTIITLNTSSLCNPVIDTPRLQDVMDANRYSFMTSDTTGITCDITSQDPLDKFNIVGTPRSIWTD